MGGGGGGAENVLACRRGKWRGGGGSFIADPVLGMPKGWGRKKDFTIGGGGGGGEACGHPYKLCP